MRRLLLLLSCLLGLSLQPAAVQAGAREIQVATLRVSGVQNSPEATAIAELNDAIAREICLRIAARCTLHPLPFADIVPGVDSGKYQLGIGNVLRTPEREGRVLFSKPLWRSSSRLVGSAGALRRAGNDVRLADLHDVTIAVERGTQQHRYLLAIAGVQKLRLVGTASVGESLDLLLQERADFSLMPVRSAYFLLQSAGGRASYTGPALVDGGLGGTVHVILPRSEGPLQRETDAALDAMRGDGTFQRILRRHMPFLAD